MNRADIEQIGSNFHNKASVFGQGLPEKRELYSNFYVFKTKRAIVRLYLARVMSMTTGVVPMQASYDPTGAENSPLSSGRYILLGPFQIDQQRQEITKNGEKLKLQGKVYRVLMALLEKPGEVVTREELRQQLWPAETYVNYDANVNTTVNKLRLALGDSSEKPIYIETIPRKGYCLLVRPEISATPRIVTASMSAPGELAAKHSESGDARPNAAMWNVAVIIGLLLMGILLGAGLTRLWISHFAPAGAWH
jgi:DNA-binding winged helix-turn-helix (wHTH) protein